MGALPRLPNTPLAMGQVRLDCPARRNPSTRRLDRAFRHRVFTVGRGFVDYVYTVYIFVLLC